MGNVEKVAQHLNVTMIFGQVEIEVVVDHIELTLGIFRQVQE